MTDGRRRRARVLAGAALVGLIALAAYLSRPARSGDWLEELGLRERFVVAGGERLRFVRTGEGPPVVLLHGLASSIFTWRALLPGLAREREVVALDLPGFGASSRPERLGLGRLERSVADLLDALELERATLVGNSLGGAVAISVAASRPELASRLVLIDSVGMGGPREVPGPVRWALSDPSAALARLGAFRRIAVWCSLRQVFHDPDLATAERVDAYLAPLQRPGTLESMRSLLASAGSARRSRPSGCPR